LKLKEGEIRTRRKCSSRHGRDKNKERVKLKYEEIETKREYIQWKEEER